VPNPVAFMNNKPAIIRAIALLTFTCLLSSCAHLSGSAKQQPAAGISEMSQAKHVALLLPLSGPLAKAGQAVRDGVLAAYYQAKQQQLSSTTVNFYNTNSSTDIINLYNQALTQGADLVIGPLDKSSIARLAKSGAIKVPTIVLNELPPNTAAPRDFIQFSLTQTGEAEQIAKRAWQDGKRSALIIVPAGQWGAEIGQAFIKAWQTQGGIIADRVALQNGQNVNSALLQLLKVEYIEEELKRPLHGKKTRLIPQPRQDADMVFMALTPDLARQIKPLLQFYYANNLTVYSTSLALGSQATPNEALDMQDVIICDMPWVMSQPQPHAYADQKNRLYALGTDAYSLSQNLAALNSTLGFTGTTGTLQLGANNKVIRQLICTTLKQLQAAKPATTPELSSSNSSEQLATDNNDFVAF
jgi:outer membrane PBP1 activator LpoA protein